MGEEFRGFHRKAALERQFDVCGVRAVQKHRAAASGRAGDVARALGLELLETVFGVERLGGLERDERPSVEGNEIRLAEGNEPPHEFGELVSIEHAPCVRRKDEVERRLEIFGENAREDGVAHLRERHSDEFDPGRGFEDDVCAAAEQKVVS